MGTHGKVEIAEQLALLDYEAANYAGAEQWFGRADLTPRSDQDTLAAAADTLSLSGKVRSAAKLFDYLRAANTRAARRSELQIGLARDPTDRQAADELRRLPAPAEWLLTSTKR